MMELEYTSGLRMDNGASYIRRSFDNVAEVGGPMPGYAEVLVEFTPTSEGGRRLPVWLGEDTTPHYMPHFVVHGGDGTYLGVEFVDGPDHPVDPGGRTYATVRFMYEPDVSYEALIVGATFDIREGGCTVGSGRVTRR